MSAARLTDAWIVAEQGQVPFVDFNLSCVLQGTQSSKALLTEVLSIFVVATDSLLTHKSLTAMHIDGLMTKKSLNIASASSVL